MKLETFWGSHTFSVKENEHWAFVFPPCRLCYAHSFGELIGGTCLDNFGVK